MKQQPQLPKQQEDGLILVGIAIAFLVFVAFIFWNKCHTEICQVVIFIQNIISFPFWKLFHVMNLQDIANSFLTNTSVLCVTPDSALGIGRQEYTPNFFHCTRNPNNIEIFELIMNSFIFNLIGVIPAAYIGIKGFLRIEKDHIRKKFYQPQPLTLENFAKEQVVNYPHLLLYTKINPFYVSNMEGQLMGMLTPIEFVKKYNLATTCSAREIKFQLEGTTSTQLSETDKVPRVDREKLYPILRNQLGNLWCGVESLSPLEIILLACHLPEAYGMDEGENISNNVFHQIKKDGVMLRDELWEVIAFQVENDSDFKPYDKKDKNGLYIYPFKDRNIANIDIENIKTDFIIKYLESNYFKKLLDEHSYISTIIMRTILDARKGGVIAPCEMRWLKFYNRRLWALLENTGRPSFFCENMATYSHFVAEITLKKKIFEPHFEVAIKGFESQLHVRHYDDNDLKQMGIEKLEIMI